MLKTSQSDLFIINEKILKDKRVIFIWVRLLLIMIKLTNFSIEKLSNLYHQRWDVEEYYKKVKNHFKCGLTLHYFLEPMKPYNVNYLSNNSILNFVDHKIYNQYDTISIRLQTQL